MRIGIVVSRWYWDEITGPMAALAEETLRKEGLAAVTVEVPGSFDIPLAVKRLLAQDDIKGVIALGAIVQGDTAHDEVIAHAVAGSLQGLMLEFGKPVLLGITGPRMTYAQAKDRVPIAAEYARACVRLVRGG